MMVRGGIGWAQVGLMKQLTLGTAGFERYGKTTRRAAFLAEMERVVPWRALSGLIEPVYPKPGNGRPPDGWNGCCTSTFCSNGSTCPTGGGRGAFRFAGDARFRQYRLGPRAGARRDHGVPLSPPSQSAPSGQAVVRRGTAEYCGNGLKVATGTIADATIVNPPSSTKNAQKARDPEMHQTKKGNQWFSGMKAHFGVDSRTKLIHPVIATTANVADSTVLPDLLHGKETRVWVIRRTLARRRSSGSAPKARDFINRRRRHRSVVDEIERAKNRTKSKVRVKVEHPIGVIKRVFGSTKVCYRGLKKDAHRLLAPPIRSAK
jgi:IS5 family transposase